MAELHKAHDGGLLEPIRCPACGKEVGQPEVMTTLDDLTGQAAAAEGAQYRCPHCGTLFEADEALDE